MATKEDTTARPTEADIQQWQTGLVDELNAKLGQLDTLLGMICGEGLDLFLRTNRTRQDDYLQCCLGLVSDAKLSVAEFDASRSWVSGKTAQK